MPSRQFTAGEYPLGCPGWSVSEAAAPAAPHVARCPWAVRRAPPGRPAVAGSTKAGSRGPLPRPDAWRHDGRALEPSAPAESAPPAAPETRGSPRPREGCESSNLQVMYSALWPPLGGESRGPLPRQEQTVGAAAGDLSEPGEHRAGRALEETGGCAPRLLERFDHDVVGFARVDEDAVGKGIHRPPMPSHQLSQGLDISLGDLGNHAPVGR